MKPDQLFKGDKQITQALGRQQTYPIHQASSFFLWMCSSSPAGADFSVLTQLNHREAEAMVLFRIGKIDFFIEKRKSGIKHPHRGQNKTGLWYIRGLIGSFTLETLPDRCVCFLIKKF